MKKYAMFCERNNQLVIDWSPERPSISFCPKCFEKKRVRILEEGED